LLLWWRGSVRDCVGKDRKTFREKCKRVLFGGLRAAEQRKLLIVVPLSTGLRKQSEVDDRSCRLVSVTEINILTIWTKPIPAHAPCFIGRFLELWIIELRLEHQMAEESFDSGVSSEHSQYTIEHKSCPDTVQKHNDLCADIWSPTSCGHNGEGYYGPKPAPYCSHIHSDSSLDHVKRSCLKRNYRQRSKPLLRSDQLASDTEPVGSVHSNPVQFIRRKAKAPGAQIQVFSDLASIKTMSSNPRDYPNGSIGPQRSSVYPEIAGSRGMESRVVHFAHEQRDVGEKAVCERSLLPDITLDERIRLTDSRSRTSLPEYSRPPLIRNYSARDYVYLPSLQQNQMASSVPVLSRQQTLRSLLANQLDEHSEVLPSEPSIENRPRDSTYSAHVQVQPTSEVASGRTVLDRITSDMSSVTLGTDQERQQLLSALLSASKPTTSSSSQTSVLQSLLQRVNPQSGVGTSRPPVLDLPQTYTPSRAVCCLAVHVTPIDLQGFIMSTHCEHARKVMHTQPSYTHWPPALFKDFLRELPEPLFTSALYPMFYDAMQVTLPDFSQSGAKLMLNILDCLPTNNQRTNRVQESAVAGLPSSQPGYANATPQAE
ncbi:hypothetical protein X801_03565, partial [Opisthorchis viverrini]